MLNTELIETFFVIWQLFLLAIIAHSVVVLLSENYIRWLISWRNSLGGIKTNITKQTITYHKVSAIFGIIVGIAMLAGSYFFISSVRKDWEKFDNIPAYQEDYF